VSFIVLRQGRGLPRDRAGAYCAAGPRPCQGGHGRDSAAPPGPPRGARPPRRTLSPPHRPQALKGWGPERWLHGQLQPELDRRPKRRRRRVGAPPWSSIPPQGPWGGRRCRARSTHAPGSCGTQNALPRAPPACPYPPRGPGGDAAAEHTVRTHLAASTQPAPCSGAPPCICIPPRGPGGDAVLHGPLVRTVWLFPVESPLPHKN
jgi:hypothetical protein